MLRGRRSCAISDRPRPSPFASPSPFRTLSPTIPAHTRNSPVSPIIPAHTQKQGGGGLIYLRSFFALAPIPAPPSKTRDSNRLLQERTASEGVPYTNCNSAFIKPSFYWELIKIVGAPTFSGRRARHIAPLYKKNTTACKTTFWGGRGLLGGSLVRT